MADDKDVDILKRVKARSKYVSEHEAANRKAQKEDTEFVYVPGAQWPDKARTQREAWGDPCMEFPQLKQFVSQVVNEQRQQRPGIKVHPASGDASEDVADILQGLIRGIEYHSRAESVYDCGYQHAVVGGRGYWRVVSEYENDDSFNQRLVIKRISDPLSVFLDPDYQEPDGGDRSYAFITEQMPKDAFKAKWPKAQVSDAEVDTGFWVSDEDHVLIADYYERVLDPRTLVALSDGNTAYKDELPPLPPGVTIVNEREVEVPSIKWYTIAGGDQILERHEWPGKIIPVVCCMGDEIMASGRRLFQGLIRHAKDTQMLFNFGMTQQAVSLALTPRAPYVAAVGQVAQTPAIKEMWDNANTRNYSVLYYEPQSVDGTVLPSPQRQQASSPDSGWLNWTQQMSMLMKSTIGMYQNNLGMQGQETSGRAIIAKKQQGDNATFHYLDNHGRAIGLTGRILIECIPTYYDTERIVHIIGPDDMPKLETINQQAPNPADPMRAIQMRDVTIGEYAVVVETGPTYATKKQEKADLIMGLVQAYPPLMQIAPDLVVKAQDLPDADQFVKRLKMTLPPNIMQSIAAEEQEQAAPDPQMMAQMEQMQQQTQQMDQFIQQLQAENQQLKAGEQSKIATAQMDAQVKSQSAQADAQIKVQAAQASAQAEMDKAQLDAQIEMQKAEMQAQVALKKAEIEAQTKLIIAQMTTPSASPDDVKEDDTGESSVLLPVLQQMAESIAALTGPKKLVRDTQGRVVQIVTANGTQAVAYDDNGRIQGVH